MPSDALTRNFDRLKSRTNRRSGRNGNAGTHGLSKVPSQTTGRPAHLGDIAFKDDDAGFIVGMRGTGKSTLAERILDIYINEKRSRRMIIIDSKPRFKGEWELDGRPTRLSGRYRNWDKDIITWPGSVVLPLRGDIKSELRLAWGTRKRIIIAQVDDSFKDLAKLDDVIRTAYRERDPRHPLLFYVDETNHFFRSPNALTGRGITMVLTSGRESYVSILLAGQRPRHVSVEAMECMTKLYAFYTSYQEDMKHLRGMGVPNTFRAPPLEMMDSNNFTFYDRRSRLMGLCHIVPTPWAHISKTKRR